MSTIRQMLAGKISYIMDDNPKEYPRSSFEGESIKNIDYVKFVRCKPQGHQLHAYEHWKRASNGSSAFMDDRGNSMIKDIVFPAIKDWPHGVVFSRDIANLKDLPAQLAVRRSASGLYSSQIFKLPALLSYSCKYAKLIQLCLSMKDKAFGKMFVYHPFIVGSGTDLIVSIFIANGFVLYGDRPAANSICMHCDRVFKSHKGDHEFTPVTIMFVTGNLSKAQISSRLTAFNADSNLLGEQVKIVVGSKAMREGHTLVACKHVFIAHEPSSISEMIQIVGRAVRKHVHSQLPPEMRTVQIRVLLTDVSSIDQVRGEPSTDEREAYHIKSRKYSQVNKIERIMYDVSIDYLINFRFKLRETPPLLGEAYPLDKAAHGKYEKALTRAYADLRNGLTPHSIYTNRFNAFYFEGEMRTVMIMIKRILLDHQPVVQIGKLGDIIRNPPFRMEYNTQLISDEVIAVAIAEITFNMDELRLFEPSVSYSLVESLYDRSPTLIDHSGYRHKVVCIGEPLCEESFLAKRLLNSIYQKDESVIDSFRQHYPTDMETEIDLEEFASVWASTIDVNEIIDSIQKQWPNESKIDSTLGKLPNQSHALLAEWAIAEAAEYSIRRRPLKLDIISYVVNYYQKKRLLFAVCNLRYTRIYDRFKYLDVDSGATWSSTVAKPSTASLPIGHAIGDHIRVYNPADRTWLEFHSVGDGIASTHPYGFYIYEERVGQTMSVALKIRFTNDAKAKGITMNFLQRPELERVAKKLKVGVASLNMKIDIINAVETAAAKAQREIFPKRVIYKLVDQ